MALKPFRYPDRRNARVKDPKEIPGLMMVEVRVSQRWNGCRIKSSVWVR